MATIDLSRSATNPHKHFTSVRAQMGRVFTDDDHNENERLHGEDERRSRVDIIGPAGSPDDGFLIKLPRVTQGKIDFDITPGTFYVGGNRLDLEQVETFQKQLDWLDMSPAAKPAAPNNTGRFDLVYLECWQQPVSAIEDSELFEVALGGPDTGVRMRLMRRVRVVSDVKNDNCRQDWDDLVAGWAGLTLGKLDEQNELVVDTTLTVGFVAGSDPNDLCSPPVAGGYLGAENQAIRVQLVDATHLTWGFDNAAPLYRVTVGPNSNGKPRKVTMLTEPKDQPHWPVAGQIVELLPWSAVLPNKEKVSEVGGFLARVDSPYDPDSRELSLSVDVPGNLGANWFTDPNSSDFLYMRVWNRGSDVTSPLTIPFVNNTPVPLGNSGLTVTFTGTDRHAADYWIIAARPETPNRVVPWDLESGRQPHGIRRYYAPLALIRWAIVNNVPKPPEVHDCRETFPPLTRLKGCCSISVGDGRSTFGDVNSIAEALAALPETGGHICLLSGVHHANVVIDGVREITISGCARRTVVVPLPNERTTPIFTIIDSRAITLEDMDFLSFRGGAVTVTGRTDGAAREVTIRNTRMVVGKTAIAVWRGAAIDILDNRVHMLDLDAAGVAIFLQADDSRVLRNNFVVVPAGRVPPPEGLPPDSGPPPDPADPCADVEPVYARPGSIIVYLTFLLQAELAMAASFRALGGIQVGAGSERITIGENQVSGGAGNGITLGTGLRLEDIPNAPADERLVIELGPKQSIRGVIDGPTVGGIGLTFDGLKSGQSFSAISDAKGNFVVRDAPPDGYQVSVSSPGYRISGIDTSAQRSGPFHIVRVEPVADRSPIEDLFAFLYDITIERNQIAGMGLCGIGVPRLDAQMIGQLGNGRGSIARTLGSGVLERLLALVGGVVVGLRIDGNRIDGCLQRPFDRQLKTWTQSSGLGGISLGICDGLLVRDNRIERCGQNDGTPVCGVFVFSGEDLEIVDNHILDNGPIVVDQQPEPGIRGGVVVVIATAYPLVELLIGTGASGGQPAARIIRNEVRQPCGQALLLGALGPVAVLDNQFSSVLAAPGLLGMLAGVVLVANLGGFPTASDSAFNLLSPNRTTVAARPAGIEQRWPGGATLFNDNQTRLGPAKGVFFAQIILSAGDVGFDGNQCDAQASTPILSNTLLVGTTVRASDSRFTEPPQRASLSLVTFSIMLNGTVNNQGDNCIVVLNARQVAGSTVDFANLVTPPSNTLCERFQLMSRGASFGIASTLRTTVIK